MKNILSSKWLRFGLAIPLLGIGAYLGIVGNASDNPVVIALGFAFLAGAVLLVLGGVQLGTAHRFGKVIQEANCLNIYTNSISFSNEKEDDLLGQPLKCLNDGKYYHMHLKTPIKRSEELGNNGHGHNGKGQTPIDLFLVRALADGIPKSTDELVEMAINSGISFGKKAPGSVLGYALTQNKNAEKVSPGIWQMPNGNGDNVEDKKEVEKEEIEKWETTLFVLPDDDDTSRYYDPREFANPVTMPSCKRYLNWSASLLQTISVGVMAVIIVGELIALIAM